MPRKAMVPADQEDRIAKVEEGEGVAVEAFRIGGTGAELRHVKAGPKCESIHGRWYCATHGVGFGNQLQKDIHIHTGKHRLAWVCFEHGIEVP